MSYEDIDKLCYRWIVEYDCWRMWSKFAQLGTVDGLCWYRWQDSPYPENLGNRKTDGCLLLVLFMCEISEAANEASGTATRHDVTPQCTKLEAAIDVLDRIPRCFSGVVESDELRGVLLCLKRHAVLTPLRNKDLTAAKVFRFFLLLINDSQYIKSGVHHL